MLVLAVDPTVRAEALVSTGASLAVRDIDAGYGPLQVLFGVSLSVPPGARVALLGTNGAGKSTLLRVAAGLLAPTRGTVEIDGDDVTALRADERVTRGLTLVEGGRSTFPSLTVAENLQMGAYSYLRDRALVSERLDDVLSLFPRLRPRLQQAAGTLSGGEQQMAAVGRALMADPRLLLIDELSLGLAPAILQEIAGVIFQLAERGTTILLVEQSLNVALDIADRSYFLEKGEVRFSGPTAELVERGDLVRSVFIGSR